jgi:hypothetical protein
MPYLGEAKNFMLEKLAEKIKAVGALEVTATNVVTWTGATKVLKSSGAHGLTTGQLVVLTALGGGTGLVVERPYYVKEVSSTEIELSQTSSFVAEEWTAAVTSATFVKLAEIAETRAAVTMAAPVKAVSEDATPVTIAASGACSYEYIGFYSAASAGTLYAVAKVTKETLAAAGSIEVKRSTLDLLAAA